MPEIIISLTSYPARIQTVDQAITTLLQQTHKADRVILWLAAQQFPQREADLPPQLLALTAQGLTIAWCADYKSYKKLVLSLQHYPENLIVTADDDLLYPSDWLERLYRAYLADPTLIHCHRAHRVGFDQHGMVLPYTKWQFCLRNVPPSFANFLTGVGGVIYPPHCFYRDVCRDELFLQLAPTADDIWFWAMLVLNNKKINVVKDNLTKLNYVPGTQDTGLWHHNMANEMKNDIALQKIFTYYPQLLKKLRMEDYSWAEKLFSVKNRGAYKVITIAGRQFKSKR